MPNVPTTYDEAKAQYNTRRKDGRTYKVLGPTLCIQPTNPNDCHADGSLDLHLYHTDVVTYNLDGTYTLASDGWNTTITSKCINTALRRTSVRVGSDGYKPNRYSATSWVLYGTPHTITWTLSARRCQSCKGTGKGYTQCETTYHKPDDEHRFWWVERHMVHVHTEYDCYHCKGTGQVTPTVSAYPLFYDGITITRDGTITTPIKYNRSIPSNVQLAS